LVTTFYVAQPFLLEEKMLSKTKGTQNVLYLKKVHAKLGNLGE
jgi:hypothetical protein